MNLDKIAKRIVAEERIKSVEDFAKEIKSTYGFVTSAEVNDYSQPSKGVFDIDIHIYVSPEVGGSKTNTLKAAVKQLAQKHGLKFSEFWSPRADRTVGEIGVAYLKRFYEENPYKITVLYYL